MAKKKKTAKKKTAKKKATKSSKKGRIKKLVEEVVSGIKKEGCQTQSAPEEKEG